MNLQSLFVTKENCSLLTDLYQLTMAAGYWTNNVTETAAFELYFRRLPPNRSYVIAAGLEQALQYLCKLHFSRSQIEWLRSLSLLQNVNPDFFDYLASFRFSGEVWAVPEGTVVFPLEPILQVRAPIVEAQILETYLLCVINSQSMVATKAARMVHAAGTAGIIDFGTRRAHGPQAGLYAARAAYLGGCIGTSNVLGGFLAEIPIYGTAAHSFMMAFPSELEAFQAYYKTFPASTVLLIDTYDTVEAARKVKQIGSDVLAVRIDSGDLLESSREVRRILDRDGLSSVKIFVSGDLNEWKIEELLRQGAPIDLFGVGTELVTSYDEPALSGIYKLVEATIRGKNRMRAKTSPGKGSYPGRKQTYRLTEGPYYSQDTLCLFEEESSDGVPLLECYVRDGEMVRDLPPLSQCREKANEEVKHLRPSYHRLTGTEEYPVVFSERLKALVSQKVP